jgi:hypothetical protein
VPQNLDVEHEVEPQDGEQEAASGGDKSDHVWMPIMTARRIAVSGRCATVRAKIPPPFGSVPGEAGGT